MFHRDVYSEKGAIPPTQPELPSPICSSGPAIQIKVLYSMCPVSYLKLQSSTYKKYTVSVRVCHHLTVKQNITSHHHQKVTTFYFVYTMRTKIAIHTGHKVCLLKVWHTYPQRCFRQTIQKHKLITENKVYGRKCSEEHTENYMSRSIIICSIQNEIQRKVWSRLNWLRVRSNYGHFWICTANGICPLWLLLSWLQGYTLNSV
jgi:hypothetical protein